MSGLQLHSPQKLHSKITSFWEPSSPLASSATQQLPNVSLRSNSVKLPSGLKKAMQRECSQVEAIKAAIHKLRTELPQFSELGFMHGRSNSYFIESPNKIRRREQKSFEMLLHKHTHERREGKPYLPELTIQSPILYPSLPSPPTPSSNHSEECNVILLKRNMRYRLEKLPIFEKPPISPDPQPNLSLTGWNPNPEEAEDFVQPL